MIQQTHINLYAVLLAVGSIQGIFLMMSLLTIGDLRRKANLLLAILMFLFAYDLFDEFLLESGYMQLLPRIAVIEHITDLLYGPVIYFYVSRITTPPRQQSVKGWLRHLVPGLLTACLAVYLMTRLPLQDFIDFIEASDTASGVLELYDFLTLSLGIFSILVYLLWSVRLVVRHQKSIGDTYSYREAVDLQWLKTMLLSLGGLFLVYLSLYVLSIFGINTPDLLDSVLYLSIIFCIFFLGFMGIRQPGLFIEDQGVREQEEIAETGPDMPPAPGYQGTGIDESQSRLILDELRSLLAENPLYLEPKLTIADLAQASGFKSHYISQAINQNLQINFFDFINRYRVEFVCKRLKDSDDNILGVAMDAGFSSKSSFYTAFRKHAGMTPKQFRALQATAVQ
ncbi:MAG: helix-turn-helix transcriptional regulator [Halioglobus sp.]|nr:helix-turn-helix transcriptional regulator [Halioglobus sp.]